jgi:hypothetical protein
MRKLLQQFNTSHGACFFCADIFSMCFHLLWGGEITLFVMKAAGTIIIGILGGLAGLAGKDLYPLLKKYIKQKFVTKKQKRS